MAWVQKMQPTIYSCTPLQIYLSNSSLYAHIEMDGAVPRGYVPLWLG